MSDDDNVLMISDLNKVRYFLDSLRESESNLLQRFEEISLEDEELYHNSLMVIKTMVYIMLHFFVFE